MATSSKDFYLNLAQNYHHMAMIAAEHGDDAGYDKYHKKEIESRRQADAFHPEDIPEAKDVRKKD